MRYRQCILECTVSREIMDSRWPRVWQRQRLDYDHYEGPLWPEIYRSSVEVDSSRNYGDAGVPADAGGSRCVD